MPEIQSQHFIYKSSDALSDTNLQTALARAKSGFIEKRKKAIQETEDFTALKQRAIQAKEKVLANLPDHLEQFEQQLESRGGNVHWAENTDELNSIVLQICQSVDAKLITKGKSMIGEEADVNACLENAGYKVKETDLGEYIIQLAKERPSHIIAPAVHKTREEVESLFKEHHSQLGERSLEEIKAIVDEARVLLREDYLAADVGITGANMLIADTGTAVVVTNEGNGDLTATLPKAHVVIASIEKVVANLDDANAVLRVLARSATGQANSVYTSFFSGPKTRQPSGEQQAFHVILLDNQRSHWLNTEYHEMLKCIRCGACMNHCPVYANVGGHAYGWVYPGPMGSVLTPLMNGLKNTHPLPNVSTFCGRCEEVCPMEIPLPKLLRQLRNDQYQQKLITNRWKFGMDLYMRLIKKPKLYRWSTNAFLRLLYYISPRKKGYRKFPFAQSWTRTRDFPAPAKRSFQSQYSTRGRPTTKSESN